MYTPMSRWLNVYQKISVFSICFTAKKHQKHPVSFLKRGVFDKNSLNFSRIKIIKKRYGFNFKAFAVKIIEFLCVS